jgi:hypothetical protein
LLGETLRGGQLGEQPVGTLLRADEAEAGERFASAFQVTGGGLRLAAPHCQLSQTEERRRDGRARANGLCEGERLLVVPLRLAPVRGSEA